MDEARTGTDQNSEPGGRDSDQPADERPDGDAEAARDARADARARGPALHPAGLEALGRLEERSGLPVELARLQLEVLGDGRVYVCLFGLLVQPHRLLLQLLGLLDARGDFLQELLFGGGFLLLLSSLFAAFSILVCHRRNSLGFFLERSKTLCIRYMRKEIVVYNKVSA